VSSQDATIRRGERNARYSSIPNRVFEDARLSMEARWLLAYLLSKPDNWIARIKDIRNMGNCGRDKAAAMVNELVATGYAEKEQRRDGGKFGNSVLVIYDEPRNAETPENQAVDGGVASLPHTDLPSTVEPSTDSPSTANPAPSKDLEIANTEYSKERENAGAIENEEDPKQLLKRVKALEIGRNENPWPGVLGSATSYALAQFRKLDPDERHLAEARRDAYLAICKAQAVKPVALGNYLRDRRFLDVSTQAARAAAVKLDRVTMKPFGPVWAGRRAFLLGRGANRIEMPGNVRELEELKFATMMRSNEGVARRRVAAKGITINDEGQLVFPDDFERAEYRRRQCEEGYPEVNRLHRLAASQQSELTEGRNGALGELCEAVPVGSPVYEAWKDFHREKNLPLWPDPGHMRVVYFPKGGPGEFAAFMKGAFAVMASDNERIEGHVHAEAE
jgi:hypothetical protein